MVACHVHEWMLWRALCYLVASSPCRQLLLCSLDVSMEKTHETKAFHTIDQYSNYSHYDWRSQFAKEAVLRPSLYMYRPQSPLPIHTVCCLVVKHGRLACLYKRLCFADVVMRTQMLPAYRAKGFFYRGLDCIFFCDYDHVEILSFLF